MVTQQDAVVNPPQVHNIIVQVAITTTTTITDNDNVHTYAHYIEQSFAII